MKHNASPAQKEKSSKKVSGKAAWRCETCGRTYEGDEQPDECPYCLFPNQAFKKIDEQE